MLVLDVCLSTWCEPCRRQCRTMSRWAALLSGAWSGVGGTLKPHAATPSGAGTAAQRLALQLLSLRPEPRDRCSRGRGRVSSGGWAGGQVGHWSSRAGAPGGRLSMSFRSVAPRLRPVRLPPCAAARRAGISACNPRLRWRISQRIDTSASAFPLGALRTSQS